MSLSWAPDECSLIIIDRAAYCVGHRDYRFSWFYYKKMYNFHSACRLRGVVVKIDTSSVNTEKVKNCCAFSVYDLIVWFVSLSFGAVSVLAVFHRGVRNPMKISDIGFLKTEPNSVSAVRFSKTRLRRFGDGFSRFIHNLSCNMIGSTVTVFFFMPYLCTSSSESLRLTVSWTNSSWKYVISSVIHIKQHTVPKNEPKTETAVNLVIPKPNRKPQLFGKPNRKPNQSHFLLTAHP